jgi:hypothetical protein
MLSFDHRIEKSEFFKEVKNILNQKIPIDVYINKGNSSMINKIFS